MSLEGKTIKQVRRMTDEEVEREHWENMQAENPICIELEDGTILFPSKDSEGAAPGKLFGYDPRRDEAFLF